jgi:hypothetical protein
MATNWALASNGATATANSGSTASKCIDGVRHVNGSWPANGWDSGTNPTGGDPDWLEVAFAASKTIHELDLITLDDNLSNSSNPTLSTTFTQYGVTAFKFQYWDGAAWQDVTGTSVTGNDKVWRQFTLGSPITTTKIRAYITGGLANSARLVEIEAWENPPPVNITTTTLPNGIAGTGYNQTLSVTGGTGSITWSLDSGSLPPGLTIPSTGTGSWGTISGAASGTYNFVVKATDSLGAFDTQALSITVTQPPTSTWASGKFVPRSGMSAWWDALVAPSGGSGPDLSLNGNDLSEGTNPPTLVPDAVNGNPWFYFDGVNDKLASPGANITFKHVFAICALDRPDFDGDECLIYGNQPNYVLASAGAGQTKFDGTNVVRYKKNGVEFATSNMQAPVNNELSILEVVIGDGMGVLEGPVILGVNGDTTNAWKGPIVEIIAYEIELAEMYVGMLYEYLAMKLYMWQKTLAGLDVWPFQPNWVYPAPVDKRVLISQSVSGARKSRQKGVKQTGMELSFETRRSEETDAAKAFWDQKYPGTSFIYRDASYTPARDLTVEFVSGVTEQPNGYHDRDYSIQIQES